MLFTNRRRKQIQRQHADDAKLAARCLQGDEDAWERIVRSYAGRIFSLSYRYAGRRDEAEDLTQEIFIRIYQNLRSFRAESGAFSNWVLKLSRNLIIDRYRSTRRFQQCGGSLELEALHIRDDIRPNPHRNVERAEACRVLGEGLRALAPETKEAVILRDLQGMAYHEMAEMLGVPEGTVKSRLNRGRLALARSLSRHPARYEMCLGN
jgi:RNA polymerase sigma-70 factor (ECF subfamily)